MNNQQTLEQALEIAKQRLQQFASQPDFLTQMEVAFTDTFDPERVAR